jgi:PKD repeat protein
MRKVSWAMLFVAAALVVASSVTSAGAAVCAADAGPGQLSSAEGPRSLVVLRGYDQAQLEAVLASSFRRLAIDGDHQIVVAQGSPKAISRFRSKSPHSTLEKLEEIESSDTAFLARARALTGSPLEPSDNVGLMLTSPVGGNGQLPEKPAAERPPIGVATTFPSDGFEGNLTTSQGGHWDLYIPSGTTQPYNWGKTTCDKAAGSYSVDSVRGGTAGPSLSCTATYPNNVAMWLEWNQTISLVGTSAPVCRFATKGKSSTATNSSGNYLDYMGFYVSPDDSVAAARGYWLYGSTWNDKWYLIEQDMTDWWVLGDLRSLSKFYFWFYFQATSGAPTGYGFRVDEFAIADAPACTISACTATVPATATVGVPFNVTSSATASGCTEALSYSWQFGETTAHIPGQNISYTFTNAGTWEWNLLVFSGDQTCVKSGTIVVAPSSTGCTGPAGTPPTHTATVAAGSPTNVNVSYTTGTTVFSQLDVLFLFDSTGSMGGAISTCQTQASTIMSTVRGMVSDSRFAVANFRDYPGFTWPGGPWTYTYGDTGDWPWRLDQDLTGDSAKVQTALNTLGANGGNDTPEAYTRALYESQFVSWRPTAKKVVILFGDAPTHDLNFAGLNKGGDPGRDSTANTGDDLDFETIVGQLRSAGIRVLAVQSSTDTEAEKTFKAASIGAEGVAGTAGQYFSLSNADQIPETIRQMMTGETTVIGRMYVAGAGDKASWVTSSPTEYTNVGASQTKSFAVTIRPPAGTPAGVYTVCVQIIGDGALLAVTTATITVTGGSSCSVSCSATVPSTGKVGTAVQFQASASVTGCTSSATWWWDFGDMTAGSTSQNPTHTYASAGSWNWQLVVTAGGVQCVKSGTIVVSTGGGCTISCSASVPATATVGVPFNVTSSASLTGCSGAPTYSWQFGETTAHIPGQNLTYTFSRPGTWEWSLLVYVGDSICVRSGTIKVVDATGCSIACTATVPTTATVGVPISVTSSATLSGCSGTPTYSWQFGETTAHIPGQNLTYTFSTPGTWEWNLLVFLGDTICVRSGTIKVSAPAACSIDCTANVPAVATVGVPINVTSSAIVLGCPDPPTYSWQFGETTAHIPGQNITYTFSRPGAWDWNLLVFSGGGWCVRRGTITVLPASGCNISCSAVVPARATVGVPINVTSSAIILGCPDPPTYSWQFGETTAHIPGQNITYTFSRPGTWDWNLLVFSGDGWCVQRGTIVVSPAAGASCSGPNSYFIPAGAHASGGGGAQWVSDVTILNTGLSTASVTIQMLERGMDNSNPTPFSLTVAPGTQAELPDVFLNRFGRNNVAAAMRICSSQPLRVMSRTYNQAAAGTFGQGIPGYPTPQALGLGEWGVLTFLYENGKYRTNIGFVNTTTSTIGVLVELYDSAGRILGVRIYTLRPWEYVQRTQIFREVTGSDVAAGTAIVRPLGGSLFAYASLVDNDTGDPTYMNAER